MNVIWVIGFMERLTSSGGGVNTVSVIGAEALAVCSLNGVMRLQRESSCHTCVHTITCYTNIDSEFLKKVLLQ